MTSEPRWRLDPEYVPVARQQVNEALDRPVSTTEERDAILELVRTAIAPLPPSILRDELIHFTAERLGLSERLVEACVLGSISPPVHATVASVHEPAEESDAPPAPGHVNLLIADPHRFGPGKTHIWLLENEKTRCGKTINNCPGEIQFSGDQRDVDCQNCLKSVRVEAEQQARQAAYENEVRQRRKRYSVYLLTPEWREKRSLVLQRDQHKCQGCLTRRATQVHHLSYAGLVDDGSVVVGCELLWDLVSVCDVCHEEGDIQRIQRRSGGGYNIRDFI